MDGGGGEVVFKLDEVGQGGRYPRPPKTDKSQFLVVGL